MRNYTLSRPTRSQQKAAPGIMAPNYHSGTSISLAVPVPATEPGKSGENSTRVGVRPLSSRGKSVGGAGRGSKRKGGSEK